MFNVKNSFARKLGLGIILLTMPIFIVSLGILFSQSRHMIRKEAVGRANSVLSAAMQRICRNLTAIETATNANSWLITKDLQPDSLLTLTNRIVRFNPHIDGCSISTEPNVFPQFGRYFSAYTIRRNDSIITVIEEQYEYFVKSWYKIPCDEGEARWVDFYDDVDSLKVTLDGMISSYSKPIYNKDHRLVAVISTDLSLSRLSKNISEERPYPNSYFMMIDREGRYFVHPDSTRLFAQTIFSGTDPRLNSDIITLGHEMTAGKQGSMAVNIDGAPCLVCYQPVPGTSWSLAVVCPDRDILEGYHQLTYIIAPLLVIGLFIILMLSQRAVVHAINPLNELLDKTQSIAAGNMEVHIPRSQREDVVGRLQNSFATMLQSLNFHMGSVRYTTEQTKQRNEELAQATRMAEDADRQKTAFIQNVSHQIRTPLNIIMGFAEILKEMTANTSQNEHFSEEEVKSITHTLDHNTKHLYRLVMMLFDSSDSGLNEELNSHKDDLVPCNDVVREAISYIKLHYPTVNINFNTQVTDDFYIHSNRVYLMRSIREILYNAAKYSDGKHVVINIETNDDRILFIVEDHGIGIPVADREHIFKFFIKVDDLSEGLGLGLPLAKRHAQNLGGDLTLDENYCDGCRFILELPKS